MCMGDSFRPTIITITTAIFFSIIVTKYQLIILADYKQIDSIYIDRVLFYFTITSIMTTYIYKILQR
jgi:hypothetical protein